MNTRNLGTAIVVLGAGYFATQAFGGISSFKTPGVKNIEARHSAAGGGINGTLARATKLGDSNDIASEGQSSLGGPDSKKFQDKIGDQRPDPSKLGEAWNKTQYSSEKGK